MDNPGGLHTAPAPTQTLTPSALAYCGRKLVLTVGSTLLFFLILVASFVLFHLTEALLSSVVVFGILWVLARAITQADHQLLRILLTSNRFDARYDPMVRQKGGHIRG